MNTSKQKKPTVKLREIKIEHEQNLRLFLKKKSEKYLKDLCKRANYVFTTITSLKKRQ